MFARISYVEARWLRLNDLMWRASEWTTSSTHSPDLTPVWYPGYPLRNGRTNMQTTRMKSRPQVVTDARRLSWAIEKTQPKWDLRRCLKRCLEKRFQPDNSPKGGERWWFSMEERKKITLNKSKGLVQGNYIFQPSIFRGHVSFQKGYTCCWMTGSFFKGLSKNHHIPG